MTLAESSVPLSQPGRLRAWLRGLSAATALSVFALIVLGGVVRVTGSGLGCPDWPLCHGGFLPPPELEAVIEYSHRLVASALLWWAPWFWLLASSPGPDFAGKGGSWFRPPWPW